MKQLSNTHHAKYMRERRFRDEAFAERARRQGRTYAARRRTKAILTRASIRAERYTRHILQRVRHHLAKGRDAADIAVREYLPASKVVEIIKSLQPNHPPGGNPTPAKS